MTINEPPLPRRQLTRSRQDRVIGGVCAGIAGRLGVDPLLVRIAAVMFAAVSGGAGLLAYLIAWVLIPQAVDGPGPQAGPSTRDTPEQRAPTGDGAVRAAWNAVGNDVRALTEGLGDHHRAPDTAAEAGGSRSPVQAFDRAATALGERLRDPNTQAGFRRAAASLSEALNASVDEVVRRVRRTS